MIALATPYALSPLSLALLWASVSQRARRHFNHWIKQAKTLMSKTAQLSQYLLWRRRTAYRRVFLDDTGALTHDARIIVAHLARLCRATASKGVTGQGPFGPHVDANATMIAVGRNEVFEAIMKELALPHQAVYQAVSQEQDATRVLG